MQKFPVLARSQHLQDGYTKSLLLVQIVAIKSKFQNYETVSCLAVDTQSKINIEEAEKAEKILMNGISKDFKN